jgi:hypothetical protein
LNNDSGFETTNGVINLVENNMLDSEIFDKFHHRKELLAIAFFRRGFNFRPPANDL